MIREMLGIAEGILQDLHNDHTEVDSLMDSIFGSDDAGERRARFHEMSSKLLAHAHAEQEILYERMKTSADEDSRRFAMEGESEHLLVEKQIQKIRAMGEPTGDAWSAELKVLKDLVEHHVKEEESDGFECAREEFDKEQLEQMGREFQDRKRALKAAA